MSDEISVEEYQLDEHLNNFVCELLWLIGLANDIRISQEMREVINKDLLFIYEQKHNFCTDIRDLFLEELNQRCQHLGQMRWENDVKKNKAKNKSWWQKIKDWIWED